MWHLGRTARSLSVPFSLIGPFIGRDLDMVSTFDDSLLSMVPFTNKTGL